MRVGPQNEDAVALDAIVVPPQVEHSITNSGPGRLTILAFVAPNPIRASEPFNRQPRERGFGDRPNRRPRMEGPRPPRDGGDDAGQMLERPQSFPPRYDRPAPQFSGGTGRRRPGGGRPFAGATSSAGDDASGEARPRTRAPGPGRPAYAGRGRQGERPFTAPPRGRPRRDGEGGAEEGERRGMPAGARSGPPRGRTPARPFTGPPRGRPARTEDAAPSEEGRRPRAARGAPWRDRPPSRGFSGPPRPAGRRPAAPRPGGAERGPARPRTGRPTSGRNERPGSDRSGPRTSGRR
jgi:hypothetical protein